MTGQGQPQHLFCVNGSADFLTVLEEFFTLEGFQVTTRVQSSDSFAQIVAARPDLIILDLNPRRDEAWDLLSQLRFSASTNCIPMIVLSTSPELIQRAQEQLPSGATAYLPKPVDLGRLLATVRRLLVPGERYGQYCS
jgi:DNA-binding response OmpR family regulator